MASMGVDGPMVRASAPGVGVNRRLGDATPLIAAELTAAHVPTNASDPA